MIELAMVRRMVRRGLLATPLVIAALWLLGGPRQGAAGAVGMAMALANLWIAGRVIGGMAENRPDLLLAAAFAAFTAGLVLVVVAGVLLNRYDVVPFQTTGLTFVIAHLTLVIWEAANTFLKIDPSKSEGTPASTTTQRTDSNKKNYDLPPDSVTARS